MVPESLEVRRGEGIAQWPLQILQRDLILALKPQSHAPAHFPDSFIYQL